ncbi:response regulator [Caenimonas sp. SL110]|uniref:response regulator n=1 Tax=Caenimonas sp. SL110 TaxID=1450524 RepID=UPI000654203D|nr:response regulator [Caenimonas sp. SL110]
MIDHERLAAIAQGSQRAGEEIIDDFRRANVLDTRSLHLAFAAADFTQMALLAHRIKGGCLMLGATGLAEACSLLSLAGRAQSTANLREAMAFYDRESAALDAYLGAFPDGVEAARAAVAHVDLHAKSCTGLHFVVAEDHDFQRDLIMKLLRRADAASVVGVEDGAKALEQINGARPVDILVLDLSMPDMDGSELLKRLAACGSPVAVILNSALSVSQMGVVMQQAAACDVRILGVVNKPLTQAALDPLVKAFRAG